MMKEGKNKIRDSMNLPRGFVFNKKHSQLCFKKIFFLLMRAAFLSFYYFMMILSSVFPIPSSAVGDNQMKRILLALSSSSEYELSGHQKFNLARNLQNGLIIKQDKKEALRWYLSSAKENHLGAQQVLGMDWSLNSFDTEKLGLSLDDSLFWLRRCAPARASCRKHLAMTLALSNQMDEALKFFHKNAMDDCDLESVMYLADFYTGMSDSEKAFPYLMKIFQISTNQEFQGDYQNLHTTPIYFRKLAKMALNSKNWTFDPELAFSVLQVSAREPYNDPESKSLLAELYLFGLVGLGNNSRENGFSNFLTSRQLYREAALLGHRHSELVESLFQKSFDSLMLPFPDYANDESGLERLYRNVFIDCTSSNHIDLRPLVIALVSTFSSNLFNERNIPQFIGCYLLPRIKDALAELSGNIGEFRDLTSDDDQDDDDDDNNNEILSFEQLENFRRSSFRNRRRGRVFSRSFSLMPSNIINSLHDITDDTTGKSIAWIFAQKIGESSNASVLIELPFTQSEILEKLSSFSSEQIRTVIIEMNSFMERRWKISKEITTKYAIDYESLIEIESQNQNNPDDELICFICQDPAKNDKSWAHLKACPYSHPDAPSHKSCLIEWFKNTNKISCPISRVTSRPVWLKLPPNSM